MAAGWKGPVPLDDGHVLAGFTCGKGALDEWLVRRAAASQEVSRAARTYVVEPDNCVVGYFSLATASLAYAGLAGRAKRNMANPVPAVLLTRFATELSYQGQGLGQAMLRSAAEAVKRAADTVGVACFLVHAKDEEAKSFYLRFGFEPSPTDALHLILLLKDIPVRLAHQLKGPEPEVTGRLPRPPGVPSGSSRTTPSHTERRPFPLVTPVTR